MLFVRKHPLYQISPIHQRQFLAPALTCCLVLPALLILVAFFYKIRLPSHSPFREKGELKPCKKHVSAPQRLSSSSLFWRKNLHFAPNWLASLPAAHHFFTPKTCFLPLEFHFFTAILHLFYTHFLSRAKFFAPTSTAFLYILPPI